MAREQRKQSKGSQSEKNAELVLHNVGDFVRTAIADSRALVKEMRRERQVSQLAGITPVFRKRHHTEAY